MATEPSADELRKERDKLQQEVWRLESLVLKHVPNAHNCADCTYSKCPFAGKGTRITACAMCAPTS